MMCKRGCALANSPPQHLDVHFSHRHVLNNQIEQQGDPKFSLISRILFSLTPYSPLSTFLTPITDFFSQPKDISYFKNYRNRSIPWVMLSTVAPKLVISQWVSILKYLLFLTIQLTSVPHSGQHFPGMTQTVLPFSRQAGQRRPGT